MDNRKVVTDMTELISENVVAFFSYMRFALGSVFMFGVAPEYFGMWFIWRGLSCLLPSWLYQWGDDKLYSLYQRLVLFFFETCTGVQVILYGESEEILKRRENVLYLANHQSTVDWLIADMVAVRGGSLGHLRYVMKDTLQLIPLYGYYFFAHGCIYVKRGKFSQKKMIQSLNYLKTRGVVTWLVIFPEGTRYYPSTPKIIERSEQYARENNLPVLKYHLVPKIKGTWLAVENLHDKLDAVYDVSVFYEGTVDKNGVRKNAPQLAEFLRGKCRKVHIWIRRISMSEVPRTETELRLWLHNLFVQKDRLAAPFLSLDNETKNWPEHKLGGHPHHLSLWSTFSSFLVFTAISIPLFCTTVGRHVYWQVALYGALGSYGWLAIRSVC